MGSNLHCNHGFLLRALAMSLLLHVVLLLQPGPNEAQPRVPRAASLVAWLPSASERNAGVPRGRHEIRPKRTAPAPPPTSPVPDRLGKPALETVSPHAPGASHGAPANDIAELDIAEGKKTYLFSLAAAARRAKKSLPAAAWVGTAEVLVSVAAGGKAMAPTLHKSSGQADIDDAALSFVGTALAHAEVPDSLRRQSFDLVVPVSFGSNK